MGVKLLTFCLTYSLTNHKQLTLIYMKFFYSKDIPLRRVKRWSFSLRELLHDPIGREQFTKFLEKEYSSENLK